MRRAKALSSLTLLLVGGVAAPPACLYPASYQCLSTLPCANRETDDCDHDDGCEVGPRCVVASCEQLAGEEACSTYCYWSSTEGGCLPSAAGCAEMDEERCLEPEDFCAWGEGCTGRPNRCSENSSRESCTSHKYCKWQAYHLH